MKNTLELRKRRAKLITDARALLNRAEEEKRGLTAEEEQSYNAMNADVDRLKGEIDREERQQALEREMETVNPPASRNTPGTDPGDEKRTAGPTGTAEYRAAFDAFLRRPALAPDEARAMSVGSDPAGGYLVPDEFERMIVEKLLDENIMRRLCTVVPTKSDRDIPVEDTAGSAYWAGETEAYTESSDTLGQVTIKSNKLTALVKVSEELLQDSAFPIDNFVTSRIAKRFGIAEEAAFVAGDGVKKPKGLLNIAAVGKTTAANNAITSDELLDLFHSLKRPYRRRGTFMFADSTVLAIRKLKNATTGDYMWQPGLKDGEPDRLLGRPVEVSDSVAAIASSAKVGIFGDFSYYWIADRGSSTIQRLVELYSANGQVGFRSFKRVDGALTLSEAVKVLQMKA